MLTEHDFLCLYVHFQDANSDLVYHKMCYTCTVEPVLRDDLFCPAKTVSQDRWSLITGTESYSTHLYTPMKTVVQDEWLLITGAAQDRFYCIFNLVCLLYSSGILRQKATVHGTNVTAHVKLSHLSANFTTSYEP